MNLSVLTKHSEEKEMLYVLHVTSCAHRSRAVRHIGRDTGSDHA